jgi:putative transposase
MNYKRLFIPNSLIFATVVTKDRKDILIENVQYLRKAFKITKEKFQFDIIAIIINKDHFHMVIRTSDINLGNYIGVTTKIG